MEHLSTRTNSDTHGKKVIDCVKLNILSGSGLCLDMGDSNRLNIFFPVFAFLCVCVCRLGKQAICV